MKKTILLIMSFLTLLGCSGAKSVPVSNTPMTVQSVPGDQPAFKRVYNVRINKNVTMTITARTGLLGRTYDGELDQGGWGKWVLFEPENPADKILDRDILPDVEKYCKIVIEDDKKFINSKPDTFTDENGVVWKRQ